MKADSIIKIEAILRSTKDAAYKEYKEYREKLETKYNTEWLDNVKLTTQEVEIYRTLRQGYTDINNAYEDFMKHEWN